MTEIEAGPGHSDSRSILRKKYEADFTFHPKISSNSQKLTENLRSDFLTRQQHHIEKQKKHYEQALQTEPSTDRPRRIRLSYAGSSGQQQQQGTDSSDDLSPTAAEAPASKGPIVRKSLGQASTAQDGQQSVAAASRQQQEVKKRSRSLPPKAGAKQQQQQQLSAYADCSRERSGSESPTTGAGEGSRRRRCSAGAGTAANMSEQRLRRAKEIAERAIRDRRVFTILGPYPRVREFLRTRGWVEKFYLKEEDKMQSLQRSIGGRPQQQRRPGAADDDAMDGDIDADADDGDGDADDGDDGDEVKNAPWEEDGGFYGLMSRIVRNSQPTLIWSLRKDQVDFKFLRKDQIVNHFGKAGCFTTKFGLCRSLRELPWFDCESADIFYPRCYVLSSEEEREAFKDDYCITACMSLLRLVGEDADAEDADDDSQTAAMTATTVANAGGGEGDASGQSEGGQKKQETARSVVQQGSPKKEKDAQGKSGNKDVKKITPKIHFKSPRPATGECVPKAVLETAIAQCERLIQDKNHDNLDDWDPSSCLSDSDWFSFLQSFYRVAHYGARIRDSASLKSKCQELCAALRMEFPQFDIDGYRNAWIVKPGAKSRGRGIFCVRTLESVMELISQPSAVGISVNKLVVQKYIERPLLVHRTKFDIRQWFVVTDFNPLTIWWYKDCYVRFCSQNFTLNDFNEAVHLSNNSIQHKYLNQRDRHPDLPEDNIWDSITFQTYLTTIGQPDIYYDVIYPGMQKAVVNSMLCSQDHVDLRKNCFELYGADFMIGEDFQPWLLEINCSPTMAASTPVTTRLCRNVQEDVLKVVIDRRYDRTCDTGRFELIYKQQQVNAPTYAGVDLTLLGQSVKKPWNSSMVAPRPERTFSLFAEERRLEREKLAAPTNQRALRGRGVSGTGEEGSESSTPSLPLEQGAAGHVTKSPNPRLLSVANRKPPTKVEIIPINTGLPKKSGGQPSYFRSKTTGYMPGRPLGGSSGHHHHHHVSIVDAYPPAAPPPPPPPPLHLLSRTPPGSQSRRLIMPASRQMSITHKYSHRN